jgi:hypothetical protein
VRQQRLRQRDGTEIVRLHHQLADRVRGLVRACPLTEPAVVHHHVYRARERDGALDRIACAAASVAVASSSGRSASDK